ncbi:MAG: Gldg family protein, partial [Clostridia bacterium]
MKNNIKSKKLKYGSLSIVFTIVFIVLIIALNLVVSSLADSVGLKIDLTDEQLFSLSNETDVALQVALGEEYKTFDVTIYFLAERDIYEYYDMNFYAASGQDKSYYTRVRDLTEEYQRKYSNNIKVEFVDINKEPELANKYKNESQTALTANNIIIQGKYHYRIITFDSLYQRSDKDNSLYSFNGEQRLTAAILQASLAEAPVISFTTGHGEKHDSALDEIFAATEFNVKTVDLMKENIDPKTKILVIFNPLSDFIGYDVNSTGTNEIDKITTYMADKTNFNSLMVFVNSSTESLPNLRE